jgi:hypothetical protein
MTFRPGIASRLYLHSLGLASYARDASVSSVTNMHDTTTLDKTAKTFIPGLEEWTAGPINGPLDTSTTAGGQYAVFAAIKTALAAGTVQSYPFTFAPLGTDGAVILGDSMKTSMDVMAGIDQTVDWSVGLQGTGQLDLNGKILENNTAVTTDTDGTALDNGASSATGAVAHLHVTAFSGLTSDDIIIEHSSTGAFAGEEATLFTFTQVTGLTSQRLTVTGTVERYLRVADDVTGTGSITRFVAVSRR